MKCDGLIALMIWPSFFNTKNIYLINLLTILFSNLEEIFPPIRVVTRRLTVPRFTAFISPNIFPDLYKVDLIFPILGIFIAPLLHIAFNILQFHIWDFQIHYHYKNYLPDVQKIFPSLTRLTKKLACHLNLFVILMDQ